MAALLQETVLPFPCPGCNSGWPFKLLQIVFKYTIFAGRCICVFTCPGKSESWFESHKSHRLYLRASWRRKNHCRSLSDWILYIPWALTWLYIHLYLHAQQIDRRLTDCKTFNLNWRIGKVRRVSGRLFFQEEEEVDEARPLRAESAMSICVNISKSAESLFVCNLTRNHSTTSNPVMVSCVLF